MIQKSRPSFTANSPIPSSKSLDLVNGVPPEAIDALKRNFIERLRWEETVSLNRLADQLSRSFKLNWSGRNFALFRNAVTAVVKVTNVPLWVCVEESDGLPLREFFNYAARSGNLASECEEVECSHYIDRIGAIQRCWSADCA